MYCIQETDKHNFMFNLFHIIQLREDKIILPIGDENISSRKARKLAQKTKRVLDKTISKKVVISQSVQKQEEYINLLNTYDLQIVKGRWLFEVLSCQILDYVLEQKNIKKQETTVSVLVNDLTENIIGNIRKMAKEYKRVNIITNHKEKFKKIETQILEQDGMILTVGNNKKKGLRKSQIILNVDFPTELINQYTLDENAIIVNIRENVEITKKRFNGMMINDYEITFQDMDEFDYDKKTKYKMSQIYEGKINPKQPFDEIMKKIERDKVKIVKLIGKNGSF